MKDSDVTHNIVSERLKELTSGRDILLELVNIRTMVEFESFLCKYEYSEIKKATARDDPGVRYLRLDTLFEELIAIRRSANFI